MNLVGTTYTVGTYDERFAKDKILKSTRIKLRTEAKFIILPKCVLEVETMEGPMDEAKHVMESLETALKDVADTKQPLHDRLGPALAALFHSANVVDLETEETMTSLVNSLVDDEHPVTVESIDRIQVNNIINDIKDCGVEAPHEELNHIIRLAIDCLRAQLVVPEEAKQIEDEVLQAMSIDMTSLTASGTARSFHHDDNSKDFHDKGDQDDDHDQVEHDEDIGSEGVDNECDLSEDDYDEHGQD